MARERRFELISALDQLTMAAKTFEHCMERYRGNPLVMLAGSKKPLLLLADAVEAAIIVNDHGNGQLFLKRCFDRKPAG